MKYLVFASKSKLVHNLTDAILPLVGLSLDVSYLTSMDEILKISHKGKKFALLILDWNICDGQREFKRDLATIAQHPRLSGARYVVMHAPRAVLDRDAFRVLVGCQFHRKPFLPEQLAAIIREGLG